MRDQRSLSLVPSKSAENTGMSGSGGVSGTQVGHDNTNIDVYRAYLDSGRGVMDMGIKKSVRLKYVSTGQTYRRFC